MMTFATPFCRRIVLSAMVGGVALAGVLVASQTVLRHASYGDGPPHGAQSQAVAKVALAGQAAATTSAVAPSGSYVMSDSQDEHGNKIPVALRPCAHVPPAGVTTGECSPVDRLKDYTTVAMRCWTDTNIKPPGQPPRWQRWFYVSEGPDGPHPGWSGYVFSGLVKGQTTTPRCTDAVVDQYEYPKYVPPPPLSFEVVGTCTTDRGVLTAKSSNFTSGASYSVAASYPDGSAYKLDSTLGTVRADGSVGWRWPCAGDPPGLYATSLVDLGTGREVEAHFRVGAAPQPAPSQPSVSTPVRPTGSGTSRQPPPPRPQPTTHIITVYNKVTNGATEMREDKPAYLSAATRNYCRRDGCMLAGTEVGTGVQLTAVCQAQGDRTTNGQNNSSVDDHNPGLYESRLWYGVRWADGRFGYVSEVWIQPGDRGGLGLHGC